MIRPFFLRHPRLRYLICNHPSARDIGIYKLWNGEKAVIQQCDWCGMVKVKEWYPIPTTFDTQKEKNVY